MSMGDLWGFWGVGAALQGRVGSAQHPMGLSPMSHGCPTPTPAWATSCPKAQGREGNDPKLFRGGLSGSPSLVVVADFPFPFSIQAGSRGVCGAASDENPTGVGKLKNQAMLTPPKRGEKTPKASSGQGWEPWCAGHGSRSPPDPQISPGVGETPPFWGFLHVQNHLGSSPLSSPPSLP